MRRLNGNATAGGWVSAWAAGLAVLLVAACGGKSDSPWDRDNGSESDGGRSGGSGGNVNLGGSEGGRIENGGNSSGGSSSGQGANAGVGAIGGSGGDVFCEPGVPPTSQLQRLTPEQYDRTVRDLLGVTNLDAADGGPPSQILSPYSEGQVTEIDWLAYQAVGEAIAVQVMADETLRGRFLSCSLDEWESACWGDTLRSFGRRAFRRPLTESELVRFERIVERGAEITETGSVQEVAEVVLNTFLVSPSFLQRTELSTEVEDSAIRLSSPEVAARLSYVLWGSTPDGDLDEAADAGALASKEQILAQAKRMLADDKARDGIWDFHKYYLAMRPGSRWGASDKSPDIIAGYTTRIVPPMLEETQRFFDAIVFRDGGSFREFFTSPLAFVNSDTAPIYGLDAGDYGSELEEVNLGAGERPGFLTRIAFLSSYSSYERTSPILRGTYIARHLLGIETGDPPPGAAETPIPQGDFATNREFTEALTAGPTCSGCHREILNPPGFVLEHFDTVGAYQDEDPLGGEIDTVADVYIDYPSGEPVTVTDPADLMQRIARSRGARHKYAERMVSYAYGRVPNSTDVCTVDELESKLAADEGYRVLDLMADLTQADSFRLRVREQ